MHKRKTSGWNIVQECESWWTTGPRGLEDVELQRAWQQYPLPFERFGLRWWCRTNEYPIPSALQCLVRQRCFGLLPADKLPPDLIRLVMEYFCDFGSGNNEDGAGQGGSRFPRIVEEWRPKERVSELSLVSSDTILASHRYKVIDAHASLVRTSALTGSIAFIAGIQLGVKLFFKGDCRCRRWDARHIWPCARPTEEFSALLLAITVGFAGAMVGAAAGNRILKLRERPSRQPPDDW